MVALLHDLIYQTTNLLLTKTVLKGEVGTLKKYIFILLCFTMLFLAACGSSKKMCVPSDKAVSCANKAIETAEKYLSYALDYKEATEIINDLQSDMEYVSVLSMEASNYFPYFNIRSVLMRLSIDLIDDNFKGSDETYSKIQDDIEELKKLIN